MVQTKDFKSIKNESGDSAHDIRIKTRSADSAGLGFLQPTAAAGEVWAAEDNRLRQEVGQDMTEKLTQLL